MEIELKVFLNVHDLQYPKQLFCNFCLYDPQQQQPSLKVSGPCDSSGSQVSFILQIFLVSVKICSKGTISQRQKRIGMRVITYLTKMINLTSQSHINQKSYPVTNLQAIKRHRSSERGQAYQGVSPDPAFVAADKHALAQNR